MIEKIVIPSPFFQIETVKTNPGTQKGKPLIVNTPVRETVSVSVVDQMSVDVILERNISLHIERKNRNVHFVIVEPLGKLWIGLVFTDTISYFQIN